MNQTQETSTVSNRGASWLVTLGFLVLISLGIRTISNADFWAHLAIGRSIAENGIQKLDTLSFSVAGNAWVNHNWLYDRAVFKLWNVGGAKLVTLVNMAVAALAFLFLLPVARKWGGGVSAGLALLLCTWILAPQFGVTPMFPAMLFAAIMIWVLSFERKAWQYWAILIPVQLLWTNSHISFLLGPIIGIIFAIQAWVLERAEASAGEPDTGSRKNPTQLVILAVVLLIVCLVNPYGMSMITGAIKASRNVVFNYVQEWISPFSGQFTGSGNGKKLVTLALLIGAAGLLTERRKLPVGVTTLTIISAFFVVRSIIYSDVFAVLAFPFLALSLNALGTFLSDRFHANLGILQTAGKVVGGLVVVISLVVVLSGSYYTMTGSASTIGLGANYDIVPAQAAEVIARTDFPPRAVNLARDGGFLLWQHPARPIFVDDHRADLYGADLFQALFKCMSPSDTAWATIEDKWAPGAVIVNCCVSGAGSALRNLLITKRWTLIYFDGTTALLVQAITPNDALIADKTVQAAGLQILEQERSRYEALLMNGKSPGISPRLIGAGEFFMGLNRFREAEGVYSLLNRALPSMLSAQLNLGLCQLELGRIPEAVETLSKACKQMPRNVMAWYCYSKACTQAGDEQEAEAAKAKAIKLNPNAATLFGEATPGEGAPAAGETP